MNKEDIERRIHKIETKIDLLDTKGKWYTRDYEEDTKLRDELSELKRQLKKLENEREDD